MSIAITNKKDCCGCEACIQICSKQCISMKVDEEGFRYPQVNAAICTECGLCVTICPIKREANTSGVTCSAYAAYYANDDIRRQSSSGGIFSMVAKTFLAENGIVFGAAYDDAFEIAHRAVRFEDEMPLLRGSKYAQSRMGTCYREAEEELKQGRNVLFTGTACQIAGLKSYLRRDYKNLFTVDVLCHGVPSPKVLRYYIHRHELLNESSVTSINMRDKSKGWLHFQMKISFDNGTLYQIFQGEDTFMRLFLANICLRPSCHACRFKSLARPSDITIGDAWGIDRTMPDMHDDKGTSVVLVHTDKGQTLLEAMKRDLVLKLGAVDTLLPPYSDSRKSVRPHKNRSRFFAILSDEVPSYELTALLKLPLWYRAVRKIGCVIGLQ